MQLLIKSIKIKNFRGYGENIEREDRFYCFDNLDRDFVLINGFNGYGKTSFYEAMEWCLSDSVKRLKKLEDVYMIPDLKKGKYLKFQKANGESTQNREVVVEIMFIDRISKEVITIIRRTYSDMLGVGEYQSTLFIQREHEEPIEILLEELDRMLFSANITPPIQTEVSEINKFLFSNILTQENLHDFLYTNDLKERQQLFLKLMSNGEIQTIRQRLNRIKPVHFTNKIKAVEKEVEAKRQALSSIAAKVQISSIQSYFEKIERHIKEVQENIKKSVGIEISLPIQIDNYIAFIQKLSLSQQEIKIKQQQTYHNLTNLRVERSKLEEIQLFNEVISFLRREAAIQALVIDNLGDLNERLLTNREHLAELQRVYTYRLQYKKTINEQYEKIEQTEKNINSLYKSKGEDFINSLQKFISVVSKETWDKFKDDVDLNALMDQDERLQTEMNRTQQQIEINEKQLEQYQKSSNQHDEMLQIVNEYIYKQDEIEQCPVCDSTTIQNEPISKTKLLHFVAETIAQGNKIRSALLMNQQTLNENIITMQKELEASRNSILNVIEKIKLKYKNEAEVADQAYTDITQSIQKIENSIRSDDRKLQTLDESIRILKLPVHFTQQQINELQAEIKGVVTETRNKLPNHLRNFNLIDIEKELQARLEGLKVEASKQQVEKWIAENEQQELDLEQLVQKIKQISSLLLNEEELPILQQQQQYEQDIEKLNEFIKSISSYKQDFENLNKNLEAEERAIIQAQLENHPIITWIFKSINPHPFYNDLEIINDKGKTQFKSGENEIQLDQIFSAAQTNILVLSIFLGLGMTQKYSVLGQLFLDDPIQSMDDVNILAFIDLLRAILGSKSEQNNLVISTHDSNFAKLLRIKMRSRTFVEYRLIGYGEEGPIIEMSMNY